MFFNIFKDVFSTMFSRDSAQLSEIFDGTHIHGGHRIGAAAAGINQEKKRADDTFGDLSSPHCPCIYSQLLILV
jgi:hypothetical protein